MSDKIETVVETQTVTTQELDKLKGEYEEKLGHVVDELKEERKKNQELKEKLTPPVPVDDTDLKIKRALEEERARQAVLNKDVALRRFIDEHKEYHPFNDQSGLLMSALNKELDNFDLSKAFTAEDFMVYLNKASKLVSQPEKSNPEPIRPPVERTVSPGSPRTVQTSDLLPEERQVINDLGWSEERYLKLKAAQPQFVKDLLSNQGRK